MALTMKSLARKAAIRHQIYENLRMSFSLRSRSVQLDAASGLLRGFCDAVLEVDHELKIVKGSCQLSTLLLHGHGQSQDLTGLDLLGFFCEEDRPRLGEVLCSEEQGTRNTARMLDALGSLVSLELLHIQFQNDDGCRCLLVGMRECQDVASVAPLRAEATADKMTLMFDACSFEILSSTGFTSDEKDLDQINLFELATGSSRTSLVSAIQSAVNSFEGTKQEHYLGSLELLGRVAQATLTLQKDDLLNTLIGTLDCRQGSTGHGPRYAEMDG
ncbi:unnamed protein product [Effrenium voratum]|nr:unnamed protein product [Effrenium voratum]